MAFLKKKNRSYMTPAILLVGGGAAAYYAAKRVPWKKVMKSEFVADLREQFADTIERVSEAIGAATTAGREVQAKGRAYLDNISEAH